MGYRGYEHRRIEPRFPFGHGLSYTTFEYGPPTLSSATFRSGGTVSLSVPVRNTGERPGTDVVQCYVSPGSPRLARPPKELKAFGRVVLAPGEITTVTLVLDDRSFAYWDPGQPDWDEVGHRFVVLGRQAVAQARRLPGWQVDAGFYDILIGRSSTDIVGRTRIEVVAT